jgi:uncharacterized protein
MNLSEINIYPVKSLTGVSVKSAKIDSYGLQYDRKWMLIDKDNKFLSQRSFPKMALLKTALTYNNLVISSNQIPVENLNIPLDPTTHEEMIKVSIWDDNVDAWRLSSEYDQWFTSALQTNCRLVYLPSASQRLVNTRYAKNEEIVGFADGFPFMLIGEGSLNDLNNRLSTPVPMARFRPNLVVQGSSPFSEDHWHIINIGKSRFEVVKPCSRCTVTTIDLETAIPGKEPLKTLAAYRTQGKKVMFGQNLLCQHGESVTVGEEVNVLSFKYAR